MTSPVIVIGHWITKESPLLRGALAASREHLIPTYSPGASLLLTSSVDSPTRRCLFCADARLHVSPLPERLLDLVPTVGSHCNWAFILLTCLSSQGAGGQKVSLWTGSSCAQEVSLWTGSLWAGNWPTHLDPRGLTSTMLGPGCIFSKQLMVDKSLSLFPCYNIILPERVCGEKCGKALSPPWLPR